MVSPTSLEDLTALVKRAEARGTTVHAVGSGHAWSDVALTGGIMVLPDGLVGLIPLDDGTLRRGLQRGSLVRVLSGTPLSDLNEALEELGLALSNMGGYDAQTIAGVVSTSTHGSGLNFGPFPSIVQSMDVVVAHGAVLRIERAGGPTSPAAFKAKFGASRQLIQDDHMFAAASCGVGVCGLIHSLVISVRKKFWLNETRRLSSWEKVRGDLKTGGPLYSAQHYELLLNPYSNDHGEHTVLITEREECGDPGGLPPAYRERNPLNEIASSLLVTWFVLDIIALTDPSIIADHIDSVLSSMQEVGYANISYKVFNIGSANDIPAYSMELAVSLEADNHIATIDRLIELAGEMREREGLTHTSPIALRFVAASDAYISMMYGQRTMMIELILEASTNRGFELLQRYQEELKQFNVRPHWGQYNVMAASDAVRLYPKWADWLRIQRQFNNSGVFNTSFTRRLGIST